MPFDSSHPDFAAAARYFGHRPDGVADLGAIRMTPERRAARRNFLNCSELPILASGDAEQINRLARIKWNEVEDVEPDALNVEAGQWMEPLILAWLEEQIGVRVTRRGEVCTSKRRPWLSCTLDGFVTYEGEPHVVQAKFYSPYMKLEKAAADRAPQVLGEAHCAGAVGTLLVIYNQGNQVEVVRIPADPAPQAELLNRAEEFWAAVQARRLPFLAPTRVFMPTALPVPRIGEADMGRDAGWQAAAARWRRAKDDAGRYEMAAATLKGLIPGEGECRAVGGGIEADRDARGTVRIRPQPAPVDMGRDNTWVDQAQTWLATRDAVDIVDEAGRALKAMLPADKKAVFGAGVRVAQTKTGSITITAHAASAPAEPSSAAA